MPAPVSLHLIVRNEPLIAAELRRLRPHVAEIVVLDTGSDPTHLQDLRAAEKDGVLRLLIGDPQELEYAGTGYINFSAARNRALSACTQPFALWMDGDDTIDGLEYLAGFIENNIAMINRNRPGVLVETMFRYEYSHHPNGDPDLVFPRERLHQNPAAWHWTSPVHETIQLKPGFERVQINADKIVWKHRRHLTSKGEPLTRNLILLRKERELEGVSFRNSFYIALTLHQMGGTERRQEAIPYFEEAIRQAYRNDDHYTTCLRLADTYHELGKDKASIPWLLLAMERLPKLPGAYFALARAHYYVALAESDPTLKREAYERCVHFAEAGLILPQPPVEQLPFLVERFGHMDIHRYLNVAYHGINAWPTALKSAEEGLKHFPQDTHLQFNRRYYAATITRDILIDAARRLKELEQESTESLVLDRVREAAEQLQLFQLGSKVSSPVPSAASSIAVQPPPPMRPDGKLRIIFACGDVWDTSWNPDVLKGKGFGGGSETAVVEMSSRLAALGHLVRVYTSCGEGGTFDGVAWKPSAELRADTPCDVLIAWRRADLLGMGAARVRVLWLHDTVAHGASAENMRLADLILTLSTWHRNHIAGQYKDWVPAERVVQTRTAISRIERFASAGASKRDPHRAAWTSSPDRGLDLLLDLWPAIRSRVPDATLHVYYGFEGWKRHAEMRGADDKAKALALERRLNETAPQGVVNHDRVTPDELAADLLHSGVWLYPNIVFPEIFCVACAEAQAAGLEVVTTNYAALDETVLGELGGTKINVLTNPPISQHDFREQFVACAVAAMTAANETLRRRRRATALSLFSYDGLAEEWEALFRQTIRVQAERGIGKFEGVL